MAALDAKTVNAKSVETVKLNCIQKAPDRSSPTHGINWCNLKKGSGRNHG